MPRTRNALAALRARDQALAVKLAALKEEQARTDAAIKAEEQRQHEKHLAALAKVVDDAGLAVLSVDDFRAWLLAAKDAVAVPSRQAHPSSVSLPPEVYTEVETERSRGVLVS